MRYPQIFAMAGFGSFIPTSHQRSDIEIDFHGGRFKLSFEPLYGLISDENQTTFS
jgi:hypothetical protein